MKTNRILLYIAVLGTIALSNSCIEDIGNYDYTSKEDLLPVKIEKLEDITIGLGETLEINPVLENLDDESKYSFVWYTLPDANFGKPVCDTLATTRNLSIKVDIIPAKYNLYYVIKDVKTNLYVSVKVPLNVTATPINSGWYILKDSDDVTDFDYVSKTGNQVKNVLSVFAPDKVLQGKAVKIAYQSSQYFHVVTDENGKKTTLNNQKIYQILSTKDVKTFNSVTLVHFKDFQDQFYGNHPTANPQDCSTQTMMGVFLLNGGKIYSYSKMMPNIGKFGAAMVAQYARSFIHSNIMVGDYSSGIGFDTINRSFVGFNSNNSYLEPFAQKEPWISPSLMQYRLVNLLQQGEHNETNDSSLPGFAIMQKDTPDDKNFYFIQILLTAGGSGDYPFLTQPELIPATAKMPLAPVKAAARAGKVVYFAYDNVLSSYTHATAIANREAVVRTFPAGEKITYVREFIRYATDTLPLGSDLVVLTSVGGNYKMYIFNVEAPGEIESAPRLEYQGQGTGRDVLLRY